MDIKPKVKKLYYSIGEVSILTKLKPYVLRYWETEFKQLKPPKNRAGNRTYRQSDIDLILFIKDLLYNKKFTIEGARTQIASMDEGIDSKEKVEKEVTVKAASVNKENLVKIKQELEKLLELLRK